MKTLFRYFFIFLLMLALPVQAETGLTTDKQKLSYALGVYFSKSIAGQTQNIDNAAFLQAIEDVLGDKQLKLTTEEMKTVLSDYQNKLKQERTARADDNLNSGEKFLEENGKKEDVVELDSGLQYKVIKKGTGEKPQSDSNVKVHYHGTLINGEVFDSSYERGEPVDLTVNQVIKGWQEALTKMPVGSKWKVYIPSELAYGERGAGDVIGPNETLIFDIELLAING